MPDGIRWTVRDRYGHEIYLTEERWLHIIDRNNHPEMADFEHSLRETVRLGRRKQDTLNPQKYVYVADFPNLVEDNTHIVAIVLFRLREDQSGRPAANNYIVTAYQKEMA